MDRFEIQVLLKDGTIADYEVLNERDSNTYEIVDGEKSIATFIGSDDGTWKVSNNPAGIDEDMQQRIINQLNGFKR